MERVSSLIVTKLTSDLEALSRFKAVTAVIPYAIFLARNGDQGMVDQILNLRVIWRHISPYLAALFDEPTPPTLNRFFIFISPCVPWGDKSHDEHTIARWAAAALAVRYPVDIRHSVVNTLLQIASIDSLRPHIPIDLWTWLKKLPSLAPRCRGRNMGKKVAVIRHVRGLGDIEILKSYFLLIWSEWNFLDTSGIDEMKTTIREEFSGAGLGHHRKDLIKRLDHVLGELGRGSGRNLSLYGLRRAEADYRRLKEVLLEVERESCGFVYWLFL